MVQTIQLEQELSTDDLITKIKLYRQSDYNQKF